MENTFLKVSLNPASSVSWYLTQIEYIVLSMGDFLNIQLSVNKSLLDVNVHLFVNQL